MNANLRQQIHTGPVQLYYCSDTNMASVDHGTRNGALICLRHNTPLARRISTWLDQLIRERNGSTHDPTWVKDGVYLQLGKNGYTIFVNDPPEWLEAALYPNGWIAFSDGKVIDMPEAR